MLERDEGGFTLWVLSAEGISPPLTLSLSSKIGLCGDCLPLVGEKGRYFLNKYIPITTCMFIKIHFTGFTV